MWGHEEVWTLLFVLLPCLLYLSTTLMIMPVDVVLSDILSRNEKNMIMQNQS
jgi:hypothetical protein